MANKSNIEVRIFGIEIGKLDYDNHQKVCYFQYNPDFLESGKYSKLFPYIFKRNAFVQVFTKYEGETFKGLPPMIADSLPDMFGNRIFKEWFDSRPEKKKISPLEQLTYVADRGMGAIEYQPVKILPEVSKIEINEIVKVLEYVLQLKDNTISYGLNDLSLLNIFKIGTSAGGARPKIVIAEHKITGQIIAGDREFNNDYNHYLVKLGIEENIGYSQEKVEYAYYKLVKQAGIEIMPSKLIDDKHFATLRYDRQNGEKQHVLTASGLSGWDFKDSKDSSYENLFILAVDLGVSHKDVIQLFKRMVFNVVFCNIDDHLKNHSFIYNKENNNWGLAPAYDITYALNPLLNYNNISRALSINGKRQNIKLTDLLTIAEEHAIKNPTKIIEEISSLTKKWNVVAVELKLPTKIISSIEKDFSLF
jgi:serine/threonine-protein kinase HipA